MSRCNDHCESIHSNVFIDLNSIPYVLAEYLDDRRGFQQIDRSLIKSEVFIDQSEAMRAIVDISIDDIGKRSDGRPNLSGNSTKLKRLLKLINDNLYNDFPNRSTELGVIRSGIIVRVSYQLENYTTREVIRTMVEDLRISNRNYFIDINSKDINDNCIITNFADSIVSTVVGFTYGRDRMILRITNIQLLYELVKQNPKVPRIKQSMNSCDNFNRVSGDHYNHHRQTQSQHIIDSNECYCENEDILNPRWSMFNRFYHFDNDGKDLILHFQEINDLMTEVQQIPCGNVRVNKTFPVNPGHRLIFKLSIWKNDITLVNNTRKIAEILGAPLDNAYHYYEHDCECNHHNCNNNDKRFEEIDYLKRTIYEMNKIQRRQSQILNTISNAIGDINIRLDKLDPPPKEEPDCECGCDHSGINKKIEDLQDEIDNLKENPGSCDCPELDPLTEEDVQQIWDEIKVNKKGEENND